MFDWLFSGHIDGIFCVHGIFSLWLATVAQALWRLGNAQRPWKWFGGFALIYSIHQCLEMLIFSLGDGPVFGAVRALLMGAAFFALLEFNRARCAESNRPVPGRWIYFPLCILIAFALFTGFFLRDILIRSAVGLPAGLWTAWTLWHEPTPQKSRPGIFLKVTAIALLVHMLSAAILNPAAQLLSAVAALVMALALWRHYTSLQSERLTKEVAAKMRGLEAVTAAGLILTLLTGAYITETIGQYADADARSKLESLALSAAASIDQEDVAAAIHLADMADPAFDHLREQCEKTGRAIPGVQHVSLFGLHENKTVYLSDTGPLHENDLPPRPPSGPFKPGPPPQQGPPPAPPGTPHREATPELIAVFRTGQAFTAGPVSDKWGIWVSGVAPVLDPRTGSAVAVLSMVLDARHWMSTIHRQRLAPLLILLLFSALLISAFMARRRAVEQEVILAASERRYRGMFEDTGAAMLLVDIVDGAIAGANEAAAQFYGWSRDALAKRSISDISTLSMEEMRRRLGVVQEGMKRNFQSRHRLASGEIRDVALAVAPIESGGQQLLCCIIHDVSDLVRANEARRSSEEKAAKAFLSSPDLIAISTLEDGRFIEANDSAYEFFGYRRDELIGHNRQEMQTWVCPEERARMVELLKTEGRVRAFEVRQRRKSGEVFIASISAERIEIDGEPCLLTVARDISKQKRAEEALREREETLRAMTTSAQDAILMIDPEGKVSFWNPAAERILGWSAQEALGQDLHALTMPSQYAEAHERALPHFRATGQGAAVGKTLELAAIRKDGREIPVAVSLAAVNLGGKWHAVGILRDISETRKYQEELQRAKEAAEQVNQDLTEAITRANEMALQAELANVAKSSFLANMSHEIRTPMNGVIGMIGLLLDSPLDPVQREYAEIVSSSAESLLEIINDILDFSKIEAGKLELEIIDFDLRVTLEEMADLLALKASEKNLEFVCLIDPEVPSRLQGDPGRIRQVLTNLAGNAVKFTEQGEVAIRVSVESESEDEVDIRFQVRDTGIGIAEDKLDILFNPFTQADTSTTRKFGGTGLGLSISKRLTELMNGQIGVESVEGEGTVFWFTARFHKQEETGEAAWTPAASLAGRRALVVDDNAANRRLLEVLLTSWGCYHAEAADAERALEMLRAAEAEGNAFEVALLDMMMPETDGEALARRILAEEPLRQVRLVMMTSLGRRGDAERLRQIGFSAYLTKPLKRNQLYECLREVLGENGGPCEETPKAALVTGRSLAEGQRRRLRILLAEDNSTNQKVALAILGKLGYRADTAANGVEALTSLESLPYDLVLMDCQMPEMDGYEATRQIRNPQSRVRNHAIPIIAMTAHAMKGDREQCLEAGMDDYVSKPISSAELKTAIERQVGRVLGSAAPPEESTTPNATETGIVVFNRASLLERMEGDAELLEVVLQTFMGDAPRQLDGIKEALEQQDAGELRRRAHALKGSAANLSAERMASVASLLEEAALGKNLASAVLLGASLQSEWIAFRSEVGARGGNEP